MHQNATRPPANKSATNDVFFSREYNNILGLAAPARMPLNNCLLQGKEQTGREEAQLQLGETSYSNKQRGKAEFKRPQ